ncbi:MAG TPA: hypothetical protein VIJ68_02730 [Candidatus Saccharimonadales bacterium]
MDFLYSVFFGAGVAAFAYSRVGRRVGYGNTQYVTLAIGAIFILVSAFFYTILAFVLNI